MRSEPTKAVLSEDSDGLGIGFIKQFMPSPPHNDTLQSVIDSYYAERRKAAAEKRKSAELEAARIADEERQRLEAEAQGLNPFSIPSSFQTLHSQTALTNQWLVSTVDRITAH